MLIHFIFFYVIVPYGAVISLGVFSCLAKRESVEEIEGANAADCPLTKIWTWLTFFALLNTGVFWFYKSVSILDDLLSGEIIGGAYFLIFLVLAAGVIFLGAWGMIFGFNQKNNPRLLGSSALNTLGVVAVLSMLFGSTFIIEFFKRAFLITH